MNILSLTVVLIHQHCHLKVWDALQFELFGTGKTTVSPRSRSQCTHTQNLCTGHNSLLSCKFSIIFHTFVVNDQRVCNYLDPKIISPRSQCTHTQICVRAITLYCHVGMMLILHVYTIVVYNPRVCHDFDPRSFSKVKVTVHTCTENVCHSAHIPKICVQTINPYYPVGIWMIFHTIVSWPWPCVISPRSRSPFTHSKNVFQGYNPSLVYTKLVCDHRYRWTAALWLKATVVMQKSR